MVRVDVRVSVYTYSCVWMCVFQYTRVHSCPCLYACACVYAFAPESGCACVPVYVCRCACACVRCLHLHSFAPESLSMCAFVRKEGVYHVLFLRVLSIEIRIGAVNYTILSVEIRLCAVYADMNLPIRLCITLMICSVMLTAPVPRSKDCVLFPKVKGCVLFPKVTWPKVTWPFFYDILWLAVWCWLSAARRWKEMCYAACIRQRASEGDEPHTV